MGADAVRQLMPRGIGTMSDVGSKNRWCSKRRRPPSHLAKPSGGALFQCTSAGARLGDSEPRVAPPHHGHYWSCG
jgi:hypothetical protein